VPHKIDLLSCQLLNQKLTNMFSSKKKTPTPCEEIYYKILHPFIERSHGQIREPEITTLIFRVDQQPINENITRCRQVWSNLLEQDRTVLECQGLAFSKDLNDPSFLERSR